MIPLLQTNMNRCPMQFYTRVVEGTQNNYKLEDGEILEQATLKEERTEFAECVGDQCMAFLRDTKRCVLIHGKGPSSDD